MNANKCLTKDYFSGKEVNKANYHIATGSHITNIRVYSKMHSLCELEDRIKYIKRIDDNNGKPIANSRSFLNESIINNPPEVIIQQLANRLSGQIFDLDNLPNKDELRLKNGERIRINAVLAFEIVAKFPSDTVWYTFNGDPAEKKIIPVPDNIKIPIKRSDDFFKMPLNNDEYKNWLYSTLEFLKEYFGVDNIVYYHTHMDRSNPHIHAIILPIYQDDTGMNRLSCGKLLGGRAELAELQTDYAKSLSYLGYKRGERFSSKQFKISSKEYKEGLDKVLSEKVPDTLLECQEVIVKLRYENYNLKTENTQILHSADVIRQLRLKKEKLRENHQKLGNYNDEVLKLVDDYERLTNFEFIKA